jgi:NAD(P)-dependent dehydrogenase (short-subunit alcohol dehydrogenase family)
MGKLDGRSALVFGASRGGGKAAAIRLAAAGADVAIAARTMRPGTAALPGSLEESAAAISATGRRAVALALDATVGSQVDAVCEEAAERLGGVDVFVHSLQYMGPGYADPLVDTPVAEIERHIAVGLTSAVRACRNLLPAMIARGEGRIVLVTSMAAQLDLEIPPPLGAMYPVVKAGLVRLVTSLAEEVRPYGVAIVGLDPGFVRAEHVDLGQVDGMYFGWSIDEAHPVGVPAAAVEYIATCEEVMALSGRNLRAADLVAEKHLLPRR